MRCAAATPVTAAPSAAHAGETSQLPSPLRSASRLLSPLRPASHCTPHELLHACSAAAHSAATAYSVACSASAARSAAAAGSAAD